MPFQSKNMHYVFNTEYLNLLAAGGEDVSRRNGDLLTTVNDPETREQILAYGQSMSEQLKKAGAMQQAYSVSYPGLLIGTGYPHITRSASGEIPTGMIQIGFTFDYATGAPYYPGSSLKGVLRAPFDRAFPKEGAPDEDAIRYLASVMAKATEGRLTEDQVTKKLVKTFRDEVFEGLDTASQKEGATLPMPLRDVFYGAFLTDSEARNGNILGFDNLTPHQESTSTEVTDENHVVLSEDVTKNPVPLTMLRILPKTVMTFSMKLNDGTEFTKEEKFRIFLRILEDFGVGAKTNVGYGTLVPYCKPSKPCSKCKKETQDWKEFEEQVFCKDCFESLSLCEMCHERPAAIDPTTKQQGKYCVYCKPLKTCNKCHKKTQDWKELGGQAYCEDCRATIALCAKCQERPVAINPETKQPGKYCTSCLEEIHRAKANMTPEEKEAQKAARKALEKEKKRLKREAEQKKKQAAKEQ